MDRTPEDLERMREALASEQSAETIPERFEPRKRTATERRTGLHIVDRTDEFMRHPVIISPAKKPTHQD